MLASADGVISWRASISKPLDRRRRIHSPWLGWCSIPPPPRRRGRRHACALQQPITGDAALIGDAQGDRHAVGQEDQSTHGSQEPSGLREPDGGVAPRGGAVLADHKVEHAAAERDLTGIGLDQREEHTVASLTSPRRVQLGAAEVHTDRVRAGRERLADKNAVPQPSSTMSRSADVAEESELGLRETEQPPPDAVTSPISSASSASVNRSLTISQRSR